MIVTRDTQLAADSCRLANKPTLLLCSSPSGAPQSCVHRILLTGCPTDLPSVSARLDADNDSALAAALAQRLGILPAGMIASTLEPNHTLLESTQRHLLTPVKIMSETSTRTDMSRNAVLLVR